MPNEEKEPISQPDEELEGQPDPSEEEDEEGQPDEEPTVELDGEQVPLSQVKEWKLGYMREDDYRKKTMALGEERKKVEQLLDEKRAAKEAEDMPDEYKEARATLDKLGYVRQDQLDSYINRKIAQQNLLTQRQKVAQATGLDDAMMDAAQVLSIRKGISLEDAAKELTGARVVRKKGMSVKPGATTGAQKVEGDGYTLAQIEAMDPDSDEFKKVEKLHEAGKLNIKS